MIGRRIIKGKAQELFEGYSVVDLGFQFRVGIALKPFWSSRHFISIRRIGFVFFGAFTDGD
jgi:hypothetical protein